jgi:hypothetical protein
LSDKTARAQAEWSISLQQRFGIPRSDLKIGTNCTSHQMNLSLQFLRGSLKRFTEEDKEATLTQSYPTLQLERV